MIASIMVRARVSAGRNGDGPALERILFLDAYAAQLIAEDVSRLGSSAKLELIVAADTPASVVAGIHRRFVTLAERGVRVDVRRVVGEGDSCTSG
jgi:hypothetical protein